jgi:hypothetical protein
MQYQLVYPRRHRAEHRLRLQGPSKEVGMLRVIFALAVVFGRPS